MKIVVTHKCCEIDYPAANVTLAIEAVSVDAVKKQFEEAAISALEAGALSFDLFNQQFYLHNVMPYVRPDHRVRWALRIPHRAPPREYVGPNGHSRYYRGVAVRTLEDWFTSASKKNGFGFHQRAIALYDP